MAVEVGVVVGDCVRLLHFEQVLLSTRARQLPLHGDLLLVALGVVEHKLFLGFPLLQLLVAADVFASSILQLP